MKPDPDTTPHEPVDENALLGAYVLDGKGGGHPMKWKGVRAWTPADGPLWVHLDRKAPDSQRWVRRHSGLDPVICEALLTEETRPRAQAHGDGMLVILRGVNLNPGSDPDEMISVRIWVDANRIITLRSSRLLAVADVRESLDAGNGPRSGAEVLVAIAARLSERMAPVLANIDDVIDGIEEKVVESASASLRRDLADIRRQTIALRRYIAPQRDAILHLQNSTLPWFGTGDRALLRECGDRTTRYVEDLDALRERSAVVHEEISSRAAEQMNRTMYVLSLVAGIFLPLGMITGLLGINVGGMPGVENPYAFAIVCVILTALAGLSMWIFRHLRFF